MGFRIEILCSFDDDETGWEVHSPGEGGRGDEQLDFVVHEQVLTDLTVGTV